MKPTTSRIQTFSHTRTIARKPGVSHQSAGMSGRRSANTAHAQHAVYRIRQEKITTNQINQQSLLYQRQTIAYMYVFMRRVIDTLRYSLAPFLWLVPSSSASQFPSSSATHRHVTHPKAVHLSLSVCVPSPANLCRLVALDAITSTWRLPPGQLSMNIPIILSHTLPPLVSSPSPSPPPPTRFPIGRQADAMPSQEKLVSNAHKFALPSASRHIPSRWRRRHTL